MPTGLEVRLQVLSGISLAPCHGASAKEAFSRQVERSLKRRRRILTDMSRVDRAIPLEDRFDRRHYGIDDSINVAVTGHSVDVAVTRYSVDVAGEGVRSKSYGQERCEKN
jgi:hypothetical protein